MKLSRLFIFYDNIDDRRGRAHRRQPKGYFTDYEYFKICIVFEVLSS